MIPPYDKPDVVIIGGGPAGLSAAVWCRELGLDAVLIEREPEVGGQLRIIHNRIENYLGLSARNGREILARFRETVERSGFDRIVYSGVEQIDAKAKRLTLVDGTELIWRALIVATGVRLRQLGVPGEDQFRGKGIIASGVRDRELVKNKSVMVIGGGDAAIENALALSDVARSVKVAYRRAAPTARESFLDALVGRTNVVLLPETILEKIDGESAVSAVQLANISTGEVWSEPTDIVLIRIGVEPNSKFVKDILDLDDRGYIKVNAFCETSASGICAAGDIAHPTSPTIITAAGSGATAAKTVYRFLAEHKQV